MYSGVKCLAVYNGGLYAGGVFNQTGTTSLSNIAKWNGSSWISVGSGFTSNPSTVLALCTYNNELHAGGNMGGGYNGIAKWIGTSWLSVGTGIQHTGGSGGLVSDLKVHNNLLYVGGQFNSGNGVVSQNLISYNGTNFVSIGAGVAGSYGITKMGVFQTDLIIAGGFTAVNGTSFKNIARYNGTSWTSFGTGVGIAGGGSFETQPIQEYNNRMIVGGFFTTEGSTSVNSITQWDGAAWLTMGSGITGYVASLVSYNNVLYAAGKFTNAGGITVKNIARWSEAGVGINEIVFDEKATAFPNPTNGNVSILLSNTESKIKTISLLNAQGSVILITNDVNSSQYQLNIESYPIGIYFIKIVTNTEIIIKKLIKN